MLTLTNALTVAGETVYQDDSNEIATFEQDAATRPTWKINDDGTVSTVPTSGEPTDLETTSKPKYYLLPQTPQISTGPDGNKQFLLIIYRQSEQAVTDPAAPIDPATDAGGGILAFTTELVSDKFDQVKASLNQQAGGSSGGNDEIELDYVQFISGDISVSVAGETGSGDAGGDQFVTSIIGTGKLGGVGANRRAVMVKLTEEGASLLGQLDKLKTLPINIQYNLTFEHRLLGVRMIAFCDVESSYTLIQTLRDQDPSYNSGYLGLSTDHQDDRIVSQVTEALVRSKTMYVTVIPESSQVSQDTITALESEGNDILNKEVAGVLEAGPPPDSLDRNQLESFVQTYNSSFNYTIDERMVLTQTFTPSANLQNLLVGTNLADLVAYVDLRTSFFTYLQIPVRVNADFDGLGLSSVTVTVKYNRQAVDGSGAQQVSDSFDFTDGATVKTFLAYANTLAEVSYDWSAQVNYKGSTQSFTLSKQGVKDNFLVVDVGQLGMLCVNFALGIVTVDYPIAVISARYQSAALGTQVATQLRLDKNTPSAMWTAIILEDPVKGFDYKVDWLHVVSDDPTKPQAEILSGTWSTQTDTSVDINAPIGQEMTIQVSCAGNFTGGEDQLSQVVAAMHYEDDANNHIVDQQLTFTSNKSVQSFSIELLDPTKRDYTYQYTNVFAGGVVERFPVDGSWAPGPPGFFTVGVMYSMTVDLYPLLFTFGSTLTAVEVDVDYEDSDANITLNETFIFSATNNTTQTWYIKGRQGGPDEFGYLVKYMWSNGTQTQTARLTSTNDKLLLPPPIPPVAPGPPAPPAPSGP